MTGARCELTTAVSHVTSLPGSGDMGGGVGTIAGLQPSINPGGEYLNPAPLPSLHCDMWFQTPRGYPSLAPPLSSQHCLPALGITASVKPQKLSLPDQDARQGLAAASLPCPALAYTSAEADVRPLQGGSAQRAPPMRAAAAVGSRLSACTVAGRVEDTEASGQSFRVTAGRQDKEQRTQGGGGCYNWWEGKD